MKSSFAMVMDILFYAVSAFVLSVCVLRYYGVTLWVALLCAAALALAAALLAWLFLGRKRSKLLTSRREREALDALMLHLALEKPERVRASLLEAYRADGKEASDGKTLTIGGEPLCFAFTMEPLSADDVARHIREYGSEVSLACNTLSAQAEKLAATFGLKIVRGDEIYALFRRTQTMPKLLCEKKRRSFKGELLRALSKTNARPFFVSGLLLLLMSLFTFFPRYYLISGSILLLCAVGIRLFGFAA